MTKKIVVFIDTNDTSYNLGRYAIELAKRLEAQVIFCDAVMSESPEYVMEETVYSQIAGIPAYHNRVKKLINIVEGRLQDICNSYKESWEHIDYKLIVDINYIDGLKKLVQTEGAKFLLMNRTQAPSFWDTWVGTTTTTIIEEVNIPTIIIPESYKFQSYKNILHHIDLESGDLKKLKTTVTLAGGFNAQVTAAYFDQDQKSDQSLFDTLTFTLNEALNYQLLDFKYYHTSDLGETCNTLIQESNIDLMAVSYHDKDLFSRLFSDDYTDKLILTTDIPFIIF